ncbi:MAG: hypothetical protein ACO3R3_10935, partial [Ilumatobacteraceae bacterium]
MRKLRTIMAPIAALAIIATACGSDDTADAPAEEPAAAAEPAEEPADEVAATQGGDITFHMVTHSDDGPFWSVVKRGMEAACEDTGVNCVWLGSNNDPGVQVQMIEQA